MTILLPPSELHMQPPSYVLTAVPTGNSVCGSICDILVTAWASLNAACSRASAMCTTCVHTHEQDLTYFLTRWWMVVMGVRVSSPSCRSYCRRTRLSTIQTS